MAQVIGRLTGGGAERLALNLAVALAPRGVRSLAVALRRSGLEAWETPAGVEVWQAGADGGRVWGAVRAALRLRGFVRRHRVDVLHVHGTRSLPLCVLATMGMARRPRVVFTWHSAELVLDDARMPQWLMMWALRRCDRAYGPSREIVEELARRAKLRRAPEVFRNGVAAGAGPERPRTRGVPVILWAGRVVPTKDPELLLRAAARLRGEGLEFRAILAGSAPPDARWYEEKVRRLILELGLGHVVSMPGWVGDVGALAWEVDIAVQSSRAEGLSLSLLEQMMAGAAVVATDVGDTARAVRDGRTGLLVPPGDLDALTGALRRLLVDPALRRRLGRAGRRLAAREFTLERMGERAERAYGEVVEEAGRG